MIPQIVILGKRYSAEEWAAEEAKLGDLDVRQIVAVPEDRPARENPLDGAVDRTTRFHLAAGHTPEKAANLARNSARRHELRKR